MRSGGGVARRWTLAEKILAAFTALLALMTGVLGFQTALITHAKEQVQVEYGHLKSQLGLPGPTADPQVPAGVNVRHSGQLFIANGVGVDLDALQADPQWGTGDAYKADISYYGNSITLFSGVNTLILGAKKADYNSCRDSTGYAAWRVADSALQPGTYVCVKTNGGRYSALRITLVTPAWLKLDVVTYDPPGS